MRWPWQRPEPVVWKGRPRLGSRWRFEGVTFELVSYTTSLDPYEPPSVVLEYRGVQPRDADDDLRAGAG